MLKRDAAVEKVRKYYVNLEVLKTFQYGVEVEAISQKDATKLAEAVFWDGDAECYDCTDVDIADITIDESVEDSDKTCADLYAVVDRNDSNRATYDEYWVAEETDSQVRFVDGSVFEK
jgi:hypothetical protein